MELRCVVAIVTGTFFGLIGAWSVPPLISFLESQLGPGLGESFAAIVGAAAGGAGSWAGICAEDRR